MTGIGRVKRGEAWPMSFESRDWPMSFESRDWVRLPMERIRRFYGTANRSSVEFDNEPSLSRPEFYI